MILKNVRLFLYFLMTTALGACGQAEIPPSQSSPEQTKTAEDIPSKGLFSVARVEAYIDKMGVTEPRLRQHMIGAAIYYAYKEGRTDLIPTVYPLN